MPKKVIKQTTDAGTEALRVGMALRGWDQAKLAEKLGATPTTIRRAFVNDFSSKALRVRINELFAPVVIFTEGIG